MWTGSGTALRCEAAWADPRPIHRRFGEMAPGNMNASRGILPFALDKTQPLCNPALTQVRVPCRMIDGYSFVDLLYKSQWWDCSDVCVILYPLIRIAPLSGDRPEKCRGESVLYGTGVVMSKTRSASASSEMMNARALRTGILAAATT
ncbi:hypothetical protein B0H11DRAFT_1905160 [Mycena galericulata]|nr:hypothetical protein B0H11DRAFT_1905160 [Mycena galericulata]